MKGLRWVCVLLIGGCAGPPARSQPDQLWARTEVSKDGTVEVGLKPGSRIGQHIDMRVFGSFWPGISANEARTRFGPPTRIVQRHLETDYIYEAQQRRVVIVETRSHSSGDGRLLSETELRAVVDASFTAALEEPLRRLVIATPGVRVVAMTSREHGEPIVHLNVRDNLVESVSAWPAPTEDAAGHGRSGED